MQMEHVSKYDGTKQYAKDKRRMVAYAEEFTRRWEVIVLLHLLDAYYVCFSDPLVCALRVLWPSGRPADDCLPTGTTGQRHWQLLDASGLDRNGWRQDGHGWAV
jgi:hypothetical protein